MNRRAFLLAGAAGAAGVASRGFVPSQAAAPAATDTLKDLFPRARVETYLNCAGGSPLSTFAEAGMVRYMDFIRLGPGEGRGEYRDEMWGGVRGRFASLIGAGEDEIGLVECTKRGEQLVLDALPGLRRGGNVVTNDLHFSGSLHNLEGLRRSGTDVRIARADDSFDVPFERMAELIDGDTALVTVSLVSNVTGRIEPIARLAEVAHAHGAIVFADVIQATGAIPIDVRGMGIDVAACSSYKWLFGIHGAGFLYVRRELQGAALPDRLFPGHVRRTHVPWGPVPATEAPAFEWSAPSDATRYQPGHVNYLGYAAAYEALGFLADIGIAEIRSRSRALVRRLLDSIDRDRWPALTPTPMDSPILSLRAPDPNELRERLAAANVVIGVGGDLPDLVRISPGVYNDEGDIDRLAEVLAAVGSPRRGIHIQGVRPPGLIPP